MPWKESCAMDERLKFIAEWKRGGATVTELSRLFGVSRKTAYKWLTRYSLAGPVGLLEQSRAPHTRPEAVSEDVIELLVGVRKRRPTWGARKILAALGRERLGVRLPAASTVAVILARRGLVRRRRKRYSAPPYGGPFASCRDPNDTWSADFKGRLVLGNGRICNPFTLSDNASRYLLRCEGLSKTNANVVQPLFESAFREYGLPLAIRTDNGPPFSSVTAGGLSRIAIWLVKLGIRPERIQPGRPTQNGRHERIHKTLQEETARPTALDMRGQQRKFDEFRRVYNDERPHEALGQRSPAEVYTSSPRRYPARIREPEYGPNEETRRVRYHGSVKWRGCDVFVSETLRGEPIGIEQTAEDQWTVRYGPLLLGHIDARNRFHRPRIVQRSR
jgi:transposase InsO family protein